MDDVLWGGVDVLSTGQDITSLRKMVLVSVMRRHFQAGDSIVGLDSLATLLAKLPSHDLSTVADIAKGKTGIKDAKPGPYPLVVTAEARSECDHFDYEGPAVLIPMVSSTGHGDASLKRIHYQEGQYAVGTILAVVRPLNPAQLSARYLYEYLSAFKDELLVSRMVGTANVSLTVKKLGDVPVPLIPFESQRQIERLMALCDRLEADQADAEAAQAQLVQALLDSLTQATDAADFRASWQRLSEHFHTLFTTEAGIDALKQTVLQLAVMGKLVPQSASDEPAVELLKRITLDKSRFDAGRSKRAIPDRLQPSLNAVPFQAPVGWTWTTFGAATICRDGERVPVSQVDRELRAKVYDYYGASGVIDKIDGYLFDKPLLLIGEDGANLINRATPIAFIARGFYWVNNHAHVIDGISEAFLDYMSLYINAIDLKPYVTGTAQPKMNQAKLNSIPVPLPPEPEQKRIVAKVNELMALCDQLKAQLAEARQQHAQLASVLVEQAVGAS